jgi:catechol 2,3-dioxygenase-like lactoylglutathione lyase family enzyme
MTSPRSVLGLHHFAWRCKDAEETRQFYEDLLGLPLVHVIQRDYVPSTGAFCPYVHIFFRMADGSHIAFFDLGDGIAALPSPNTPDWVNHIALRVDSREDLLAMKTRLEQHGVSVLGITDHDGYIESIYFFDPNGFRLELTVEVADVGAVDGFAAEAHGLLRSWTIGRPRRAVEGVTP